MGLDLAEKGLDAAFADLGGFARACRYRNCRHRGEPGWAVEAAAENRLDPERSEIQRRLDREIRSRQLAAQAGATAAERNRWRSVRKKCRRMRRDEPGADPRSAFAAASAVDPARVFRPGGGGPVEIGGFIDGGLRPCNRAKIPPRCDDGAKIGSPRTFGCRK